MKKRYMKMNKKKADMIKIICGFTVLIGSMVLGAYVGGWLMFVRPILDACKAFDAGTLTGLMVGTTVLKCIFAGTIGGLIIYIGARVSSVLFD